ncbi:MAG: hypothetical protein KDB90_05340 [Planctomycetes bacterium]|nr:hypothetical protein [Planctomycetota bacterium]
MRRTLLGAALIALLAGSMAAQDEEPVPGAKIIERTKADALLLLPQAGVGGSDRVRLSCDEQKQSEIKIDVEGCEKMKGYISTPVGLDKSRKHAMVFSLWGRGEDGAEDLKMSSRLSSPQDPIIFAGLTYRALRQVDEQMSVSELVATEDALTKGFAWLLNKVMSDYPVDPSRVFLVGGGFDWEERAGSWAAELWESDPDSFPFRGCLFEGYDLKFVAESAPPVPTVMIDWEYSDQDSEYNSRRSVNSLLARGIPAEYHKVPRSFLDERGDRIIQVMRAAINCLGGPGAEEYPPDESRYLGARIAADDIPWTEHKDPWAKEVIAYAQAEDWKAAWERGNGILNDKNIKTKEKRDLKDFMKEFEKYVKDECDRLDASIQKSIKADFWPNTWHWERLKAMNRAFKDENWYQKKGYSKTLETLKTYGPARRDEARREKLLQAVKLELEGKRAEAKKIYQEVAKEKKEDGGVSTWPYAAEYRLSWWMEVE